MNENPSKFKSFFASTAGKATIIVVFYLIIFGIIMLFVKIDSAYLALIVMAIFAYFGWKALNRITPDVFLFMPIGGWIAYFVIKLVLSIVIGIFIAPFVISKSIAEKIQENIIES